MKLIQGQLDEFQIYTYIFSQYEVQLPYILWSKFKFLHCNQPISGLSVYVCHQHQSLTHLSYFFLPFLFSSSYICISPLFTSLYIPLLLHIPIILISPIFCFPFLSTSTTLHVSLDAAHPASLSIPPSSSSPLSLFLLLSLLFLLSSVFPHHPGIVVAWLGVPSGGSRDGSHSRPSETSASGSRTSKAKSRRRFGTCSRRSTKRADSSFNADHIVEIAVSNVVCNFNFGRRFEYQDPKFQLLVDSIYRWWSNKIHIWSVTFNV